MRHPILQPRHVLRFAVMALTMSLPAMVSAAVPSAALSRHDPCMVFCPFGDLSYHVTVRDLAGNPITNSSVVLDFSTGAFPHCTPIGGSADINPTAKTVRVFTNPAGVATFQLGLGGCCTGVRIFADGVPLATVDMKSPDLDGSLTVNAADAAQMSSLRAGPYTSCGDLDCDNVVGQADSDLLQTHSGHACVVITPVSKRSWSGLKGLFHR